MFKFATATILAAYAHSISLSLESEGVNCSDCRSLAEWESKIVDLALAVNDGTE